MKRQNEAKLMQLSTTIQNNLQKLMSSTFQRTLQENGVIKAEVSFPFPMSFTNCTILNIINIRLVYQFIVKQMH